MKEKSVKFLQRVQRDLLNRTLEDYERIAPITCRFCNDAPTLGGIEYYDHDGGYEVQGFSKRQWLYRTCRKCGHQWSLVHLGVPQ